MKTLNHVVLMMGILIPLVRGQDQAELDKLLAELNVVTVDSSTLYKLQQYGGHRVMAALRAAFDTHEQKRTRQDLAIVLMRLGDKDDKYFRYLEAFAKEAVDSDAPDMFVYGADGVPLKPAQWSPEFYAWSARHGMPIDSAVKQAYQTFPSDLGLFSVAATDPRGTELLRRGLQSHNPLVVFTCASILASINDTASIPVVLQLINTEKNKPTAELLVASIATFNGDEIERRILGSLASPKLKEYYLHRLEGKHKQPPPPAQ
jgi:HEAT repeat protein